MGNSLAGAVVLSPLGGGAGASVCGRLMLGIIAYGWRVAKG
jgi:hypothetical protein